ncbi:protein RKD1-like [Vicia villosa]|uniref:protein RKD1-like n=1 Tax=Vicia villosa TaxID=3911 RepID=UPI00273B7084|nr:protein RKD1-like [Vicia villosa]
MENVDQLPVWKYDHAMQDYDPILPPFPSSYDNHNNYLYRGNSSDDYISKDWLSHYGFPMHDTHFDAIPVKEYCHPEYQYETFPNEISTQISIQDYGFCDAKNEVSTWSEFDAGFISEKNMFSIGNNIGEKNAMENVKGKRCREENTNSARMLTRKNISEFFYMPISQAARQLNVGLTHLKKRCRDLGIQRWPHRKLMSLQTLIKNVQEQGNENDEKIRNAVEILQKEMKKVEEKPDLQLEENTKRLRQACFKANYKKRRLMVMRLMDQQHSSLSESESVNNYKME